MKPKNHMVLTTFMLPAGYHKDSWRMEGASGAIGRRALRWPQFGPSRHSVACPLT